MRTAALFLPLFLLPAAFLAARAGEESEIPGSMAETLIEWLDSDGDGRVDRFEAAAEAMRLVAEWDADGDGLCVHEIDAIVRSVREPGYEEGERVLAEHDSDGDGALSPEEAPDWLSDSFEKFDADGNGRIDRDEIDGAIAWYETPEWDDPEEETDRLLEHDADGDGALAPEEVPADEETLHGDFPYADANADGRLDRSELLAYLRRELLPAWFEWRDGALVMYGTIDASTPARFLEALWRHPEARRLVLAWVGGSVDDDATLLTARWVRERGMETVVPKGGMIASGGVELFVAGAQRRIADGARVGVHSWGAGPFEGSEYPADSPEHAIYLDFYREMGIDPAFYRFTLEAAPSDKIHWMTREEIERFGLETTPNAG